MVNLTGFRAASFQQILRPASRCDIEYVLQLHKEHPSCKSSDLLQWSVAPKALNTLKNKAPWERIFVWHLNSKF